MATREERAIGVALLVVGLLFIFVFSGTSDSPDSTNLLIGVAMAVVGLLLAFRESAQHVPDETKKITEKAFHKKIIEDGEVTFEENSVNKETRVAENG